MLNKEYIEYLNTLHNVGARNENSIAEASQGNKFYKEIMIKRPINDFIIKCLTNDAPHIILITGHAGDGKTSLLIQVLQELNVVKEVLKPSDSVILPNGHDCLYIKDFSEFSTVARNEKLKECLHQSKQGKFVILVANTGPLLNAFSEVLGSEGEQAQIQLIDAIDTNSGEIKDISGYSVRAINVAGIDNSSFVEPFLRKLISDKCFDKCNECFKKFNCPIFNNRNLIYENSEKVFEFLHNHFIWQQEHGKRLTIRQIIAQITFALTAGLECVNIKNIDSKKYLFTYLFSNSLFGYKGIKKDVSALQVQAIYDINNNGYDNKSLISDEDIFILQNFTSFHPVIKEMILELKDNYINSKSILDWQKAVRRMFILFNIEANIDRNSEITKNIFSRKFPRYLELRSGKSVNYEDKNLIIEALSVLFIGHANKNIHKISITMKRENGVDQSVQMLYRTIENRDIRLKMLNSCNCNFGDMEKKELFLEVLNKDIEYPISLPLLNYFEDIRNGIISTNIDPQLSHGIDSIKAQLLALCKPYLQNETIELLVMNINSFNSVMLQKENNNWILI